jgi:hypothetical protein
MTSPAKMDQRAVELSLPPASTESRIVGPLQLTILCIQTDLDLKEESTNFAARAERHRLLTELIYNLRQPAALYIPVRLRG